jgi:hypothetical protein
MESPSAMIAELNDRIGKNNRSISDYKRMLGKILSGMDIAVFKGSLLELQHSKTTETELTLQSGKERLAQYRSVKARFDEENERIQKRNREILEKEREFSPHYGRLGEIAYHFYKENPDECEAYGDIFRELSFCETDVGRIQKNVIDTERASAQKNAFFKFLDLGKKLYLQGSLKSKQKRYENLLVTAGKDVAVSELFTLLGTDSIPQVLVKKVGEMKAVLKKLEDERAEMVKVREEYALQLDEITGGEKSDRFAGRLEGSIKAGERTLSECLVKFADMYLENQKALGLHESDEAMARNIRVIQALQKENRDYEKLLRRFQASLAITGIRKKIEVDKKRIEMLDKEILRRTEEKEGIQKSIRQLEEEEKTQVKIRGPEETLFLHGEDAAGEA